MRTGVLRLVQRGNTASKYPLTKLAPDEDAIVNAMPHKNPNTNSRALGVSTDTGHDRSEPWQMQAGQLVLSGHDRLGEQDRLGQAGQPGVAQTAKAVDTPLASSGITSGSRCVKHNIPKMT